MKKHCFPLTYQPKINRVINGEIRQTIRPGRRIEVGDLIAFHGWTGRPYRTKWSFKTPYWKVILAEPIIIFERGIYWPWNDTLRDWGFSGLDALADLDGIDPPVGQALGEVLKKYHNIPRYGLDAQIIRWEWSGSECPGNG